MSVSLTSSTRVRHPGLPTEQLFKLFRAAIKDADTGESVIHFAFQDIVSYDHERARSVMELVVRRDPPAWSALCALLAEARDAHPNITGLPPTCRLKSQAIMPRRRNCSLLLLRLRAAEIGTEGHLSNSGTRSRLEPWATWQRAWQSGEPDLSEI
jgi:hypothetical protein